MRFRYGVDAAFMPRIAAPDTADGKPASTQCTVLFDGFTGVMGTGGVKTAIAAQQGTEDKLVTTDDEDQDMFHPPTLNLPKWRYKC